MEIKRLYVFNVELDNVKVRPIRIIADCYKSALDKFERWSKIQKKKGYNVIAHFECDYDIFE